MPTLTVNVVDHNTNRPIPGAVVTISGTAVLTNNNGQASFDAPQSTYNIKVSRYNYTPANSVLTLVSNQTTTIKLIPKVGLL